MDIDHYKTALLPQIGLLIIKPIIVIKRIIQPVIIIMTLLIQVRY